jgi:hypothetical protein
MNTMNRHTALHYDHYGIPPRNCPSSQRCTRPVKDPQRTNRRHLDIGVGVRPDRRRHKARAVGSGVKRIAMFDEIGHYSWRIIGANQNPRALVLGNPVGPVSCFFGTYTVDERAKTKTIQIERCTFPQWDGMIDATDNIAMPTENELILTTTKPIQIRRWEPSFPI